MQSCASARSPDVQQAASTFVSAVPVVLVEADGAGPRLGLGGGGGLHVGQVLGVPQVGQQVLQRRPVGPCVDGGQVRGVSGGVGWEGRRRKSGGGKKKRLRVKEGGEGELKNEEAKGI